MSRQQRLKIIRMPQPLLLNVFNWWRNPPGYITIPVADELPEDAEVISVHENYAARAIDIIVRSDEFEVSAECALIPHVNLSELQVIPFGRTLVMPSLSAYVLDAALTKLDTEANALHVCSQEPADYTEATSTYTLGNKATPSVGAPADTTGGRKVTVAAITDGTATATGTATHWALVDTVNSRLLATGALSASQGITSGNTLTLDAFDVAIAVA